MLHSFPAKPGLLAILSKVSWLSICACFHTANKPIATCPEVKGLNQNEWSWDFSSGQTPSYFNASMGKLEAGGRLRLKAPDEGPTLISDWYIFYGYVEAKIKAAPGAGIVTAITLLSWDLDEIDWELVGTKNHEVQSNFFGKGFEGTYDRGKTHDVSSPQTVEHTYAIDWTPERVQWILDGTVIRTLYPYQFQGAGFYPQSPMAVRIGSWIVGSPGNTQGNIEWAGGLVDFSKGPFDMYVSKVTVKNYNPAENYLYSDKSGSASSIKIIKEGKSTNIGNPSADKPGKS